VHVQHLLAHPRLWVGPAAARSLLQATEALVVVQLQQNNTSAQAHDILQTFLAFKMLRLLL